MNIIDTLIREPQLRWFILFTWMTFVMVYRWGVNRWLYLNYPKLKKRKIFYCSSCFGFWLCFIISGFDLVTSASAFLIFNFYEKNK